LEERKQNIKIKSPTSGISEEQEENSMIFPRSPLLQMEFEGILGHYFAIGSE
jgi:hypothetical protein